VIALMSLTEVGFVGLRSAYFAMLGASTSTTAWLWYVMSGWHLGPVLLAVGTIGLIFAKSEYWGELVSAVLAIGLALLGLEMLYSGVTGLFGDLLFHKVVDSGGGAQLGEQLSFVGVGAILGLILQSASSVLLVLLTVVPGANLTLATGTSLFLGANLGLAVTALILSRGTRAATRRLAWSYFVTKGIGVVGTLFLFPTFLGLVERVVFLFDTEANLITQLVVAQLLFNVINSIVFGLLAEPMLRVLAHYIPEKHLRSLGLAKRVRRMLFQDADLASKELERQLKLLELEVKSNYDQVMHRLTTVSNKDAFRGRAMRERNFRSLKFTIHDLLFSVDRNQNNGHDKGVIILSLLEYYGALSRTMFHLEDHYEKGLSKKFRFPDELQVGLKNFKALLDELWLETLLPAPAETSTTYQGETLEEIVLDLNKRLGVEYQGYSTWLMETAGFLRLISSDLGQVIQRRTQLREWTEAKAVVEA